MALTEMGVAVADAVLEVTESSGSRGRTAFQWGGTISAIFLLLLNRIGRRSSLQSSLLVLYLFTSFPTVMFKILRGQIGCWLAFVAAAFLVFPSL
ncbi:cold-regulated 413 plasma membrane protein 1-like isoform X5 [Actinidia eriantha]|uniref:cold-regulated 413 plasma membrane protein 1-like isoform X5 n=1 Tax=Actinidia eriantha TaxID=165200 RepID=UPI00258D9D94|nr:cold-regulated 413 plasma membrane protein 1-like isoform X5 [Actinidia eriantha]